MPEKRLLSPDRIAVASLAAMALAFFAPALVSGGMFAGGDIEAYYLPYWTYIAEHIREGRIPLWNPYIGLGMPLQAQIETGVFYLPNAIFYAFPGYKTILSLVALHVLLSGVFAYLFARKVAGLGPLAATVTATIIMFSGYTSSQVVHIGIIASGAWFMALLFFAAGMFKAADLRSAAAYGLLAGVALAIEVLAQGSQIIYLSFLALPMLGLCLCLPQRRWARLFGGILAPGLVAFPLAAVQLLPTVELAFLSVRGAGLAWEEITAFSVDPLYLLVSLALPSFSFSTLNGAGSAPFAQTIGYAGILALVAAAFGLRHGPRDRYLAFALSTLMLSLFFALGKFNPLYRFLYDFLPGIGMLRVPGRWLFLTVFSFALLAGIGIDILWRKPTKSEERAATFCRWAACVVSGAVLGLMTINVIVSPSSITFDRTNPLSSPVREPIAFAAIAIGLVYFIGKSHRWRDLLALAAVAAVFADLFLFSRLLPFNWPAAASSVPVLTSLRSEPGLFRVAKPFNWQSTALLPARVSEVDAYTTQNLARLERLKSAIATNPEPLLDLLNVKYTLVSPRGSASTLTHSPPEGLLAVQRAAFLPRAFVVHNATSTTGEEALAAMSKPGFDPRRVAFVEDGPEISHQPSIAGSVKVIEYLPERVRLRANLPADGYLVLSDTYYPGWRAYVDGGESTIFRADHLFRAVYLDRGSHEVSFHFDPPLYKLGLAISSLSLFALVCALIALLRIRTKPSSRKRTS